MKNLLCILRILCLSAIPYSQLNADKLFFSPDNTQTGSIPIIAYMGVPGTQSSDVTFKDFRQAGFDVCISNYSSIQEAQKALYYAERQGVKIIARCPETMKHPQKVAKALKGYKALYGYLIDDEPNAERFHELRSVIDIMKKEDNEHLFYINLLPYYGKTILKVTKTGSYQEYVQRGTALGSQVISFDHYPIVKEKIRKEWYENLEIIRQESLRTGKPFWGFVLSTPHLDYPQPTLASLRLQAYANLAYGAQAIQYYSYWTSKPNGKCDWHDGPISNEGKKTKTYEIVKNMNEELRAVGNLFSGAKILSVHHLMDIPEGTTKQPSLPVNLASLSIRGGVGAIISVFSKDNHQYLAMVNKDHQHYMTVFIEAKNDKLIHITKKLKTEKLKSSYPVPGGDILLFRLK